MQPAQFGLIAMRRGGLAKAFVALGSLSLILVYAAPIAKAFTIPVIPRVHALHSLTVPTFRFPLMRIPAATPAATTHPAAAHAPIAVSAATAQHLARVPVISDTRDLRPAAPPPLTATAAQSTSLPPIVAVTSSVVSMANASMP